MVGFGRRIQANKGRGGLTLAAGLLALGLTACDSASQSPASVATGRAELEEKARSAPAPKPAESWSREARQDATPSPKRPGAPGAKTTGAPMPAAGKGASEAGAGSDGQASSDALQRMRSPVKKNAELLEKDADTSANLAEQVKKEIQSDRREDLGSMDKAKRDGVRRVQGGDSFPAAAHDSFQELAVHMESADRFIEEFEANKVMERWTRAREQVSRCEVLAEGMADEFAGFPGLDEAQSTIEERRKTLEASRPGDGK